MALGAFTFDGNRLSGRGSGTFPGTTVRLFRADANCAQGTAIVNGSLVQASQRLGADGRFRFDDFRVSGSTNFPNFERSDDERRSVLRAVSVED